MSPDNFCHQLLAYASLLLLTNPQLPQKLQILLRYLSDFDNFLASNKTSGSLTISRQKGVNNQRLRELLVSLRFVDSYGNSEANNINYVTVSLFITSQADFLSDPLLRISTFMQLLVKYFTLPFISFASIFHSPNFFICTQTFGEWSGMVLAISKQ